jgi:8-oxo-dGTP diphosphatase
MPDLAPKKRTILGVGGVVYHRDMRGRVLVLLIKKYGGYWTLPKGKIKPKETEVEALSREMQEEVGLVGRVGPPVQTVTYTIMKRGEPRHKQVAYYLYETDAGEPRPSAEERIEQATWFTPRAALRRIERSRVRAVLEHALERLREPGSAPGH